MQTARKNVTICFMNELNKCSNTSWLHDLAAINKSTVHHINTIAITLQLTPLI